MKRYRYVSLFSGAGGLDIGLERAGLCATALSEIEKVFCDTLRANQGFLHSDGNEYFKDSEILNADICSLCAADLTLGQPVDLVVGGPPCQAFSSSGKQMSLLDPRGALINEFLRIVDEVQPKMFLFENVRGVITARDFEGEPGGVIRTLLDRFWELGYSCRASLLNAADFGAYQRRVRCFIIGSRNGCAPEFPEPTHLKDPSMFHSPWNSLEDFLRDHADEEEANYTFPSLQLASELELLPNGSGLKSKGRSEATRPSGHWGYRQGTFIADLGLPARTVTGSASQDWIRWEGKLRRLTLQEVKALQGFPEDWTILGNKAQQYKQVGNAVPAVFGEILGRLINRFLENFPDDAPQRLDIPQSFQGYINYTKRDQERNGATRTVHKRFAKG